MIKRIRLIRHSKHLLFDEELSPGINAFIGRSGAGKSAAIPRPLRLLCFNRPLGDSYAYNPKIMGLPGNKYDGGPTSVEIWLEDKGRIARIKGKDENYYELEGFDAKLIGFGNGPPPLEITKALNMGEVNFQNQHAPPYLLSTTNEAEIARTINAFANLDDISDSLSRVNAILDADAKAVRTHEDAIKKANQDLLQYEALDSLETHITWIERTEIQEEALRIRGKEARTVAGKLSRAEIRVNRYLPLPKIRTSSQSLRVDIDQIATLQNRAEEAYKVATRLKLAETKVNRYLELPEVHRLTLSISDDLNRAETLKGQSKEMKALAARLKKAENALALYRNLKRAKIKALQIDAGDLAKAEELQTKGKALRELAQKWGEAEAKYLETKESLHKVRATLSKIKPKTCPLCNKPW
jgi:hypothetical protein